MFDDFAPDYPAVRALAAKVFHTGVLRTLPHGCAITTYVVIDSRKDQRG